MKKTFKHKAKLHTDFCSKSSPETLTTKYQIFPETGKVVCTIYDPYTYNKIYKAIKVVFPDYEIPVSNYVRIIPETETTEGTFVFMDKSVCLSEDEFNIITGTNQAKLKTLFRRDRYIDQMIQLLMEEFCKVQSETYIALFNREVKDLTKKEIEVREEKEEWKGLTLMSTIKKLMKSIFG